MTETTRHKMTEREIALVGRIGERSRERVANLIEILHRMRVKESAIAHGLERVSRWPESDLLAVLRDEGLVSSEQEARASALLRDSRFFDRSIVDRVPFERIKRACETVQVSLKHQRAYVPVEVDDTAGKRPELTVLVSRDADRADAVAAFPGFDVKFGYASARTVRTVYQHGFAQTEAAFVECMTAFETQIASGVGGTGVQDVLTAMLRHASLIGASDIALKVVGRSGTVTLKTGGVWRRVLECSRAAYDRCVQAITTACEGNDGEEARIFRDTSFNRKGSLGDVLRTQLADYEYRVAIGRAVAGTSVTIRILDEGTEVLDIEGIGVEDRDLANLRLIASRRSGMFVIVGPTGSGKTTFLHAFLKDSFDALGAYVQTAERPVEYRIPNASQYPLELRLEESVALEQVRRGLMRNAPNVILLGEIRTAEAAGYALDFSNTGHLLVSTFHADSAPMGLRRLLALGLDPVDLASQLLGIMAMRLVDQLCPQCKLPEERQEFSNWTASAHARGVTQLYRRSAGGCPDCNFVGYRGRFAIYELMLNNEEVQEALVRNASERELRAAGIGAGGSLLDAALKGLDRGAAGVEEVLRAMPASMGWRQ